MVRAMERESLSAELEAALLRELRSCFDWENHARFRSKLAPPVFALSEAAGRLGQWMRATRTLELSRALVLERPWSEVLSVLQHEMAHQFVDEVLGVRDESAHGETFQRVCAERGIDARAAGAPVPADRAETDRVLELYCGAANFTLSIAKRVRKVVAVEGHRPSVDTGKLNAELNGLSNIRWIASHVPAAVKQLAKRQERFSKIVLDPPRAGAKGIEQNLAALNAEKILYVSCNPTTLARDLAGLAKHGYKLTRVQPIDLFPQTFHVETVAEMTR